MTIYDAAIYVARLMAQVEGVQQSPDVPPEKASDFPFVAVYPGDGQASSYAMGALKKLLTYLVVEIHVTRRDLAADMTKVIPLLERALDKLMSDPTLGGNVQTIIMTADQPITYTLAGMSYGGMDTIGWRVTLRIKQETEVS